MNLGSIQFWEILAGIGLFLFGMKLFEDALQAIAGRSFKKFIRNNTNTHLKAVLTGIIITSILHSSGIVSLLVMSFAGAGIIELTHGIGVILGANLGTTFTGWIFSIIGFKFNIADFVYPVILIAGIGSIFVKKEKHISIFKLMMGFGLLFLGLNFMKSGMEQFSNQLDLKFLEDKPYVLFLITGLFVAAAIQSSTATVMILLSSLSANIISIHQAIYVLIGADIGSTATALIGSIRGNAIKKKIGYAHLIFNLTTALLAIGCMGLYQQLINKIFNIHDPLLVLVAFHSTMNVAGIIVFFPFIGKFSKMMERIVLEKKESKVKYLTDVSPTEIPLAIEAFEKEAIHFLKTTLQVLRSYFHIQPYPADDHINLYIQLKKYEEEVTSYYLKIQENKLDKNEIRKMNDLIASFRNATLSVKDIKDVYHNISDINRSANDELHKKYHQIKTSQEFIYKSIEDILSGKQINGQDIMRLKHKTKEIHLESNQMMIQLFKEENIVEINFPTMLNMISEISNSNASLMQSMTYLLNHLEEN
jgi:phosphate:Na+ symporter